MASVIRVKRRRGEDPAEALLLSCKRIRHSREGEADASIQNVLSFAGTIDSKSAPVSAHIREAIKQRKSMNELHPTLGDVKHNYSTRADLASRIRSQKAQSSHNNRYRVLSEKRALNLAELDKGSKDQASLAINTQENAPGKELSESPLASASDSYHSLPESQNASSDSSILVCAKNLKGTESSVDSRLNKTFCILDIEEDTGQQDPFFGVAQQSASGITVNSVPMVCRKAEPEATDDSQFVYDLYYTHSSLTDLDLQAALTVEALCEASFVPEMADDGEDWPRGGLNGESDDSNDESNWRNDYPDEDPHFFENDDYDYAEDMVDTGYLNDDESDLLAYWMGSRCNVESRSDDDEDEYGDDESDTIDG